VIENILETFDLTLDDGKMILVGIAVFWAYYKVASATLFTPLLRLIEARESVTEGAKQGASQLEEDALRIEQEYEDGLLHARQTAVASKLGKLAAVSKESSSIVAEAEASAKQLVVRERQELSALEDRLRSELEADVEPLAESLVGKLLSGQGVAAQSLLLVVGLSLVSASFPELALAGGGAGHVPSIADTFSYWVNFLLFVGFMGFILRRPFLSFWSGRSETIENAVNAGKEAARVAQERLELARERTAGLADEIAALEARISTESEEESKRLLSEARQRAEAIKVRAQEAARAERLNVEVRIREELANRVVERAEQIARERLDAASDRRLRDATLSSVDQLIQ